QLDDLDQLAAHALAGQHQPARLELGGELVVELVTVAVALLDLRPAVGPPREAALLELAAEGSEPHGAALFGDAALLVHEIDDLRRRLGIELARVRLLPARHVARELDGRDLHAEAQAEVRNPALAREAGGRDLALDAALAEAARHQHAVDVVQVGRGV